MIDIFWKIFEQAFVLIARPIKRHLDVKKAFRAQRDRVLTLRLTNDRVDELNALRAFLVDNGLTNKAEEVRTFFENWLNSPRLLIGHGVPNAYSAEEWGQMTADLKAIKL